MGSAGLRAEKSVSFTLAMGSIVATQHHRYPYCAPGLEFIWIVWESLVDLEAHTDTSSFPFASWVLLIERELAL